MRCILLGILLLASSQAFAQAPTFRYGSTNYPTLAQAEAAMRAAHTAGADFYQCGEVGGGTGSATLNYCTPIRSVSHWFNEYYSESTAQLCSNTNEAKTGYCATEDDLVQAYTNNYFATNPDKCVAGAPTLAGTHTNQPITTWVVNNHLVNGNSVTHATAGHINSSNRRTATASYRFCNAPTGPTYNLPFYVNFASHHKCPAGYVVQYPSATYQWAAVCKGPTAAIYKQAAEAANSSPNTCNPCVPATGEKLWHDTDAVIAGQAFERHYASLHDAQSLSGLGPKWSHSWNERFTPSPGTGSKAKWRNAGNDLEEFTWVSGSTTLMKSDRGTGNTVSKQADGSWVLQGAEGGTRLFSATGQLLSLSPPDNPAAGMSFTWTGGKLESALDTRGRGFMLVYVGGVLTELRDQAGQTLASYGYAAGKLTSVTYPGSKTRQYHYGEAARLCEGAAGCSPGDFADWLTGVTDERGIRIMSINYDGSGRVTSLDTPHGAAATSLSYHATQRQTTVVKAGEGSAQWTFDGTPARRPASKVTSLGGTTVGTETWTYASDNSSVRHKDLRTVESLKQFDSAGRLTAVIEAERKAGNTALPEKRTTSITWNSATPTMPSAIEVKNAAGTAVLRTEMTYNARGQLQTHTVIDPATSVSRVTSWSYCEAADVADPGTYCPILGLTRTVTAPGSAVTTYRYRVEDEAGCAANPAQCPYRKGDLWQAVDPVGQITTVLARDAAGRPTKLQDPNSVETDLTYTARGHLQQFTVKGATTAGDATTALTWTDDGQVAKVTDPDGVVLSFGYDNFGRLVSTTDGAGQHVDLTLDAAGNATEEQVRDASNALRRKVSRVFDGLSRLQSESDGLSNATTFTNDAHANPLTATDAAGTLTQSVYDNRDRLTSSTADVGGIAAQVQLSYDTLDRVTQVTDPKGLATTYSYNAFGDLTQLVSPDTGTTTHTYGGDGFRATSTDARGVVTTYGHDAIGRLTSVDYSGGSTEDVAYTWDTSPSGCASGETFAAGRLGTMTAGSGSTRYCYDRRGNMVRKIQVTSGVTLQVRYGYTKADRLAWIEYPDG